MGKLDRNKAGLALGLLFGLLHLGWAVLIALGWAGPLMDWILGLHFIKLSYALTAFNAGTALVLITVRFVVGYIGGWILACIWNSVNKK
ncbi:MAG: hypothetical protein AABX85_02455 [Nanoarchaeota archaeon]